MPEPTKPNVLTPQSPEHLVRIILGGLAVAAAVFRFAVHRGKWDREEIIVTAMFFVGGAGIIFTKKVVALINAITPWKDKVGSG